MQISPATMRLLMDLDAPADQKVALMKAMEADWLAYQRPSSAVGINEETERLRNASTYAERKRKKDRERQAAIREEARQSRDQSRDPATNRATSTATAGDETAIVDDLSSLSRPLPPQTPLTPTHTHPDINTRARGGASKPNGFARFWEAYPHKVGKGAAEKAYVRAIGKIGGHDPPAVLLAGVERAKASREWSEGYIPHPTTWLNQGRWDDEPAEVIPITGRTHERPHHDAKFEARQANLARAFAGADRAAGREWKP